VALEGRCSESAEELARGAFEAFGQMNRPIERNMLRAVLRPASDVREVEQLYKEGGFEIVAKPYVGELWILVVVHGTLVSVATTETLKQLGLDVAGGISLALKNTLETKLPVLDRAVPLRGTYFAVLAEDYYESTRLLMHAEWGEVAKARGGDLIVTVPASDSLIFGNVRNNDQIKALQDIAIREARKSRRAVSTQIFRWRPDGWELVGDPGEVRAHVSSSVYRAVTAEPLPASEAPPASTSAR
jgi:hypothetical protein